MATLILLDLDNVRLEFARLPMAEPLPRGTEPDTIVVVGLNTATVTGFRGPAFPTLDDIAGRVPSLFTADPGDVGVEIALTLTMPGAVDDVLLRLLTAAPCEDHAVDVDVVVLISADRGLRREVQARLIEQGFRGRHVADSELPVYMWSGGHFPRHPPPRPAARAGASPPVPMWTTPLREAGHAAWASTQLNAVQTNLDELAHRVERLPGELSLLGPTTASVRGVARLSGLGTPISTDDGAEAHLLHAPPARPPVVHPPRAASVGNGAVHLPLHGATVRTRLPLDVIRHAWSAAHVRFATGTQGCTCHGEVDDRAVLDAAYVVSPGQVVGPAVRVAIQSRRDPHRIKFSVGVGAPGAWWSDGRKAMGDVTIPDPEQSFAGAMVVAARMLVAPVGLDRQLWMTSSITGWPRTVDLSTSIPGGTLRCGRVGRESVAVRSVHHGLAGSFLAVPIQAVSPEAADRLALHPHFWTVPVVVPLDEVSDVLHSGRLQLLEDA